MGKKKNMCTENINNVEDLITLVAEDGSNKSAFNRLRKFVPDYAGMTNKEIAAEIISNDLVYEPIEVTTVDRIRDCAANVCGGTVSMWLWFQMNKIVEPYLPLCKNCKSLVPEGFLCLHDPETGMMPNALCVSCCENENAGEPYRTNKTTYSSNPDWEAQTKEMHKKEMMKAGVDPGPEDEVGQLFKEIFDSSEE